MRFDKRLIIALLISQIPWVVSAAVVYPKLNSTQISAAGGMLSANNLSEVPTPGTARTNLGLASGVTCAGAPTSSFTTSSNGIVTHC